MVNSQQQKRSIGKSIKAKILFQYKLKLRNLKKMRKLL